MTKPLHKIGLWALLLFSLISNAQTKIDINLDVKHSVGGVDNFDRPKFINIHSNTSDPEWTTRHGANFTDDLRDDFLNGYDVYLGRDTGGISWSINNVVTEDPSRTGYANPSVITSEGTRAKNQYATQTDAHAYDWRNEKQILALQLHPAYPDGQLTNKGWALSTADNAPTEPFGTATGEFFGRYLNESFGTGGLTGQVKPKLIEVINEPLWHLVDFGDDTPEQVFKFHNNVADQIRLYNNDPDLKISGFCTAFPDFEKNNFQQWEDRWKLFMDMSGDKMDMWAIHLYDFPSINGGRELYRKGSNMEATMDMMEHYSTIKFGHPKPFLISEYGAQMHDYFGTWSEYRDWLHNKSVNSMIMQYLERANNIESALNFVIVKATWGTNGVDNTYNHRLLRRENEPESLTGDWIYTDMVQPYQLWQNVNGTRTDSKSSNPDIMTDVYIDGSKVYLIINNLDFISHELEINMFGTSNNVQSVLVRHMHLNDAATRGIIEEETLSTPPSTLTIKPEGTFVLEYTFDNEIIINETSTEVKHYANEINQEIVKDTPIEFNFDGITTGTHGEAVLRLGIWRNHGNSLQPLLLVNGFPIEVPENFRGGPQTDRTSFYGVIEIPIPYNILNSGSTNTITATFDDVSQGRIASAAIQVFEFSREINRSTDVQEVSVTPEDILIGITQERQLVHTVLPETAIDKSVIWSSNNPSIASVDQFGRVTGVAIGTTTIIVTTNDGGFTAETSVEVQNDIVPVPVEIININPNITDVYIGKKVTLTTEVIPIDADDNTIKWSSSDINIATIDEDTGELTPINLGSVTITASSQDGSGINQILNLTVNPFVEASADFDNRSKYINIPFKSNEPLNVTIDYQAESGETVTNIRFWVKEFGPGGWFEEVDNVYIDLSSENGKNSGTVTGTLDISQFEISSKDLNGFYWLWVQIETTNGVLEIKNEPGSSPISNPVEEFIIEGATLAINEFDINNVNIYPNPVKDLISFDNIENVKTINIYNTLGFIVISETAQQSIEISQLGSGLYIIEFITDNGAKEIRRIIIE